MFGQRLGRRFRRTINYDADSDAVVKEAGLRLGRHELNSRCADREVESRSLRSPPARMTSALAAKVRCAAASASGSSVMACSSALIVSTAEVRSWPEFSKLRQVLARHELPAPALV